MHNNIHVHVGAEFPSSFPPSAISGSIRSDEIIARLSAADFLVVDSRVCFYVHNAWWSQHVFEGKHLRQISIQVLFSPPWPIVEMLRLCVLACVSGDLGPVVSPRGGRHSHELDIAGDCDDTYLRFLIDIGKLNVRLCALMMISRKQIESDRTMRKKIRE